MDQALIERDFSYHKPDSAVGVEIQKCRDVFKITPMPTEQQVDWARFAGPT